MRLWTVLFMAPADEDGPAHECGAQVWETSRKRATWRAARDLHRYFGIVGKLRLIWCRKGDCRHEQVQP